MERLLRPSADSTTHCVLRRTISSIAVRTSPSGTGSSAGADLEAPVGEGRLCGTHVGEFLGFAPTEREVELPFVAFYRFDADGKLTSERVVMNLGPLGSPAP